MRSGDKKISASDAKSRGQPRHLAGMHIRAALAGICTLFLGGACFSPVYDPDCKISCNLSNGPHACPGNLHCVAVEGSPAQTFCAAPETATCSAAPVSNSAPRILSYHGMDLTLPEAIRSQLVLLLWPSSLPPVDAPVARWLDQSGHNNDAIANRDDSLPHVIDSGGVRFSPTFGAGFQIPDDPTLAFKADDLAVIVVAGVATIMPVTIFRKSDRNAAMPRQVSLDWAFVPDVDAPRAQATFNATSVLSSLVMVPPVVAVYTMWRHAGHLELRVNGTVFGSADLPGEQDSVENSESVFIGMNSETGTPIDTVGAVVVVRGRIDVGDLVMVETFASQVFATVP